MHDLAAPARRLAGDRLAALEYEHPPAAAREGGRAREADDPRPDDEDVDLGRHAACGLDAGDVRMSARNAARRRGEETIRSRKSTT